MSWDTYFCDGVKLKNNTDQTFAFFFPQSPGSVNYILRPQGNLKLGATLTAVIRIVNKGGHPAFGGYDTSPVPPGNPPNCRFVLHSANDEQWQSNNGRWYVSGSGSRCVPLLVGTFGYSVKLDPALWQNVDGKFIPSEFEKTLNNMSDLGFAFGSGNSDGHGVYIRSGQAKFALKSLTIQ